MNSWARDILRGAIILLMCIIILACTASGRVETEEMDEIAGKFLIGLSDENYLEAANLFYVPEEFTLDTEKDDILKALLIIFDELGSLKSYKKATSSLYHHVYLMTASVEYWQRFPPFFQQAYEVQYSNKGLGYITFHYSRIQERLVINKVLFGLPVTETHTQSTIQQILVRLKNEVTA